MCVTVLEAYVKDLIAAGHKDLVAFYTSTLPPDHQVDCYAKFLEGMRLVFSYTARNWQLNLCLFLLFLLTHTKCFAISLVSKV